MNLDWRRLKAVVLESDDWGLCAWVPDEQAYRVLADTPAWRSWAGSLYGRSTLESAADVERLASTLLDFRGSDGFPPVWQANTVFAAPDFSRLVPPMFEVESLPLVLAPEFPSRWQRPGMWEQVTRAHEAGLWWPELHGLHHLPEATWLRALRRGAPDARRAHGHQCLVCEAVEASSEYDSSEPAELRSRNLALAVERFTALFGRMPTSLCPPDYRWDEQLEADAERLGITTIQGRGEQIGHPIPRLWRVLQRIRWPNVRGRRFYVPPRTSFEPRGGKDPQVRFGTAYTHRAARRWWSQGWPLIVSSHRANYAHLDAAWSEASRAALRDLLRLLADDGAVFLTDAELRQLVERAWSVRPIGERGALVRYYGVPREAIRFSVPPGVTRVAFRENRPNDQAHVELENGAVRCQVNPGEYLLEWRRE